MACMPRMARWLAGSLARRLSGPECDSWNNDSAFAQIFSVTLKRCI